MSAFIFLCKNSEAFYLPLNTESLVSKSSICVSLDVLLISMAKKSLLFAKNVLQVY